MLPPREILAVVQLVYFVPALALSLMASWRHGFRKQLGWFSLIMLCLFRICGASTLIAATTEAHLSSGLITASLVFTSFGLASLIVALQGYMSRLHDGMPDFYLSSHVFRLLHLATSAAIALAIVSATYLDDSQPGNDNEGGTLERAAVIIFISVFVGLVLVYAAIILHRDQVVTSERPLLIASGISLPLLAVRIIFPILAVFNIDPNVFSLQSSTTIAVVAQAMMVTIEEFVIVATFLAAGFLPILGSSRVQVDDNDVRKLEGRV